VSDQDLRTFLLGSAVGALLIQRRLLADDLVVHQPRGAGAAGHSAHQALARRRPWNGVTQNP
jgi:hypothetical protein